MQSAAFRPALLLARTRRDDAATPKHSAAAALQRKRSRHDLAASSRPGSRCTASEYQKSGTKVRNAPARPPNCFFWFQIASTSPRQTHLGSGPYSNRECSFLQENSLLLQVSAGDAQQAYLMCKTEHPKSKLSVEENPFVDSLKTCAQHCQRAIRAIWKSGLNACQAHG